jgi:hypothetical protein
MKTSMDYRIYRVDGEGSSDINMCQKNRQTV